MSNQDQNGQQQPIIHILSNTFRQRKCFMFCYIRLKLEGEDRLLQRQPGRSPTCLLKD